jgi:hypothetical protein
MPTVKINKGSDRMSKKKKTKKLTAKKKLAPKKKAVVKKSAAAKKSKKPAPKKKAAKRSRGNQQLTESVLEPTRRGLGSGSGGQSGDTQGLSLRERADSESVTELEEEGQYFEAETVDAIENAPDPERGPLRTREVPEDDVPEEYQDERETDDDE